ncbi:hypothetical protein L0222_17395 [bacterium]|nr:hypothetical protein [bacterium]
MNYQLGCDPEIGKFEMSRLEECGGGLPQVFKNGGFLPPGLTAHHRFDATRLIHCGRLFTDEAS